MRSKSITLLILVILMGCHRTVAKIEPPEKPLDRAPIASISAAPVSGVLPLSVNFDASASYDPDPGDSIVLFSWDFEGDGNWDQSGQSSTGSYTFETAGSHTVHLRVSDRGGLTGLATKTITVLPPENLPPVGMARAEPAVGDPPLTVILSADGSYDIDGTIVLYEWDFNGDGVWDESNPTPLTQQTFVEAGYHKIAVRVTDDDGLSASAVITVAVGVSPWQVFNIYEGDVSYYSLSFDDDGAPAIAYSGMALSFGRFSGSEWVSESIIEDRFVSGGIHLDFTADKQPRVTYDWFPDTSLVRTASLLDGVWWKEKVSGPSDLFVGYRVTSPSLAYDSFERPSLAYLSDQSPFTEPSGLYYLQFSVWSGGGWHTTIVDETIPYDPLMAAFSTRTSLRYDESGNPLIAYTDMETRPAPYHTLPVVKIARWVGGTWSFETVKEETGDSFPFDISVAFDNGGRPAVAYDSSSAQQAIKLAHHDGSSWNTETVESGEGIKPFLTYDTAGQPAIGYFTSNGLNYAWKSGAGWDKEIIDNVTVPPGIVWWNWEEPQILFDEYGNPSILYYDHASGILKYAKRVTAP